MASKLARQLREMRIHNNYNLLVKFGEKSDIACEYRISAPQSCMAQATVVWSPRFETYPDSPWYDHGNKVFIGKRAESMPEAMAWASKKYEITEWVTSPFGGKISKAVLDRVKAAVKAAAKE